MPFNRTSFTTLLLLILCLPALASVPPSNTKEAQRRKQIKNTKILKSIGTKGPSQGRIGLATKPPPLTQKQKQFRRHLGFGKYLIYHEKDCAGAVKELKKAIRLNSKHATPHGLTVDCYRKLGQHRKAIQAAKAWAQRTPRDPKAWNELAVSHQKAGDLDKAQAAFERSLATRKITHRALESLFDIVHRAYRKKPTDALKNRLLQLAQKRAAMRPNDRSPKGRLFERTVVELREGPTALAYLDGRRLYEKAFSDWRRIGAQMNEAYDKMNIVLAQEPKHAGALYYQGMIHLSIKSQKHHSLSKGLAKLTAADDHEPALVALGRYWRTQDELERSVAYLERATQLKSPTSAAWYELGLAYKLDGKRAKAIAALEASVDRDPRSLWAQKAIVELSILAPDNKRVMRVLRRGGFKAEVFNTEKYRSALTLLEKRMGGVDPNAPELEALTQMMNRLLDAAEAKNRDMFRIKVTHTKMVNAFAVADGSIYFTRGFLAMIKQRFPDRPMDADHGAGAFTMGHEIVHGLRQHTIRTDVFKRSNKGRRLPRHALVAVTADHEIEADREGMRLLFLAGYNPRDAVQLFRVMAKSKGDIPPGLDHPTYDQRIHYLEEYWSNEMAFAYASFNQGVEHIREGQRTETKDLNAAAKLYQKGIEDIRRFTVAFHRTKEALNNLGLAYAKLGIFQLAKDGRHCPLCDWHTSFSVEPELALQFVSLRTRRKKRARAGEPGLPIALRTAKTYFQEALKKDTSYERAGLNLALVLISMSDYPAAEAQLTQLQKQCPLDTRCAVQWPQVQNLIGVVRAEQGRVEEAVKAFKDSLRKTPSTARPSIQLFNLGQALEKAGQKDAAKDAYNKFLRADAVPGTSGWATKARAAVERLSD